MEIRFALNLIRRFRRLKPPICVNLRIKGFITVGRGFTAPTDCNKPLYEDVAHLFKHAVPKNFVAEGFDEARTVDKQHGRGVLLMLLGILLRLLPSLIARDQMFVVGLTIAALGLVSLVAAFIQRRSAKKSQIAFKA